MADPIADKVLVIGAMIAFVRGIEEGAAAIHTVPSLGGQQRKLIDISGPLFAYGGKERGNDTIRELASTSFSAR